MLSCLIFPLLRSSSTAAVPPSSQRPPLWHHLTVLVTDVDNFECRSTTTSHVRWLFVKDDMKSAVGSATFVRSNIALVSPRASSQLVTIDDAVSNFTVAFVESRVSIQARQGVMLMMLSATTNFLQEGELLRIEDSAVALSSETASVVLCVVGGNISSNLSVTILGSSIVQEGSDAYILDTSPLKAKPAAALGPSFTVNLNIANSNNISVISNGVERSISGILRASFITAVHSFHLAITNSTILLRSSHTVLGIRLI